jgi:hypothetical protein
VVTVSTAHIAERQQTAPEPVAVPPTSRRKALVAVVVGGLLLGIAGGGVGTYVAQQNTGDIARGRAADIARLQGQADAYLSELATERGRAADAQRMQAYADWWLGTHR